MRIAVAASPGRRAVEERARAWRESASSAGAFPNPSLDVRTENWQPGGRAAGDPLNDTFVVLTQPVELSGKAGARRRVAEAEAAALATRRESGHASAHARSGPLLPGGRRCAGSPGPAGRAAREHARSGDNPRPACHGRRHCRGRPAQGRGRSRPPGHRGHPRAGRSADEPRVARCAAWDERRPVQPGDLVVPERTPFSPRSPTPWRTCPR